MDFERSQFGKMQLWIVEHFHLHKKLPVLMNHNIWKNYMLRFITTGTFLWRWKCSTIQSCILPEWLFLQNPYFSLHFKSRKKLTVWIGETWPLAKSDFYYLTLNRRISSLPSQKSKRRPQRLRRTVVPTS